MGSSQSRTIPSSPPPQQQPDKRRSSGNPASNLTTSDSSSPSFVGATTCTSAQFHGFHQLWSTAITGGGEHDLRDPEIRHAVQRLSATAEQHLASMQAGRAHLWPDLSPVQLSINFRKCYGRLRTIALAYSVDGTSVYHDAKVLKTILQSLDFINQEAYNSSTILNPDENWWNYKIGASKPLIDIGMILYEELGPERRQEYGLTISKIVGDLDARSLIGSNRANMCQVLIGASILMQDCDEFHRGRDALFDINGGGKNSLFGLVSSGEGFYEDGSYLSHHVYPYAGGYGLTHLLAVSQLAYVLEGSASALSPAEMSVIFKSIRETFAPFVFRGMIMGNVRGREISRKNDNDAHAGQLLIQVILRLIATASEPYKADFKSLVLAWHDEAPFVDMGDSSIVIASGIQKLRQSNGSVAVHDTGFQMLPMSDRVVFHQQNWSASLALSSTRIGRYETLNAENLRPSSQGDGFLQVYLDTDRAYFLDDYYATMDPHHTPGTTAGQNVQELAPYRSTAYHDWAGGLRWRNLGAASLEHLSHDKYVSAKKSWFFLANAILALGTSCNGTNGTEVHTTMEARKSRSGVSGLVVDGVSTDSSLFTSWKKTYAQASWAHLDGVGGYHFLDSAAITIERSTVAGRWSDINQYPDYAAFDALSIQEYTTIYRNHLVDPVGDSYAYALLPNVTAAATEQLAHRPAFFVLANSVRVQAVSFHRNQTYMATFWAPGQIRDLHALTPCQVGWGSSKFADREYTVSVSDPTQKLDRIALRLQSRSIGAVLFRDPEIAYTRANQSGVYVEVDTRNSHGRTYTIRFQRNK
ncbi:hypothetical protein PVAG01_01921 [Phlyctema vagabunda]|uniref:Hyaluronate lyase n=1 Tax=Phlyctema vagabunda TaxID=108571 RepID=A0ABR4PYG5_9HELO